VCECECECVSECVGMTWLLLVVLVLLGVSASHSLTRLFSSNARVSDGGKSSRELELQKEYHSERVSERASERELLTINSNNGGGVSERVSDGVSEGFDKRSPLYQHLPDCRKEEKIVRISKKTTRKGLVCPMFRDEEGFLAEYVVSE
jgi:hypothetical protein